MPRVAFIGLGRMGHGMAGRYLDEGFRVAVWNRSKAKAEDLIARRLRREGRGEGRVSTDAGASHGHDSAAAGWRFLPRFAGEVASNTSRRGQNRRLLHLHQLPSIPGARMPPPPCFAWSPSPASRRRNSVPASSFTFV